MGKKYKKGHERSKGGRNMGNCKRRERERAREESRKRDKNKDRPGNPIRLEQLKNLTSVKNTRIGN